MVVSKRSSAGLCDRALPSCQNSSHECLTCEQGQTGIALLKFRETRLQLYVSSSCDESVTILGPNLHNMKS